MLSLQYTKPLIVQASTENSVLAICAIILIPLLFNQFPVDTIIEIILIWTMFVPYSYFNKSNHIFALDMIYGATVTFFTIFLSYLKQKSTLLSITTKEELIEMNEKLASDAKTDSLTGLLNKKAFEYTFIESNQLHSHSKYAYVLFDIDDFKLVNDYFGHLEGDKILKEFAKCLKEEFPTDIIGRIGGDEFALIISEFEDVTLLQTIQLLLNKISKNLILPNGKHSHASAGIYVTNNRKEKFQFLYYHADKALYEAKNLGKNRAVLKNNGKGRILIIDDSAINRKIIKKYFESDYEIDEANDGKEALDLIYKYRYDYSVILLDLEMPGINGFEVLNTIRNDEVLRDLKIVVVTSHTEDELKSLKCGADEMIGKPFDADVFKERVERLIK